MAMPAGDLLEEVVVGPQPGPQTLFLSTPADICIYGGMAGGGKTFGLIFEPLRHIVPTEERPKGVAGFSGVIFRRTMPQVRNEGGLWDESMQLYPQFGGKPRETITEWVWPHLHGQTIRFAGMQHEEDKENWQGAQIPYIGFDELTHFTEEQFFYLLSRNRSMCGIRPYVRATCNPDAESWVADFIAWWIDQDENSPTYGLPIMERAGVLRYFYRVQGVMHWADRPEELYHLMPAQLLDLGIDPRLLIKSVTFIPASVHDNKILLAKNPEYIGNLLALSLVERERLLGGNWKIRPTSGNIFNEAWWAGKITKAIPAELRLVRYWDKAATAQDENARAAYTAGVLLGKSRHNLYYVLDVKEAQLTSLARERMIQQTAIDDEQEYGEGVRIWIEQEPGSGGKESAESSIRGLTGFHVKAEKVTGDKVARAMPASAQVEAGNVYLKEDSTWNKKFIQQGQAFPVGLWKDMIDAFTGAFNKLSKYKRRDIDDWPTSSR